MTCPAVNNKDVVSQFNQIVESLGGDPLTIEEFKDPNLRKLRSGINYAAMNAAYKIWDANNGNPIDKTPDGKQSALFETLVDSFNGDISKASAMKANTFSTKFTDVYGEWYNEVDVAEPTIDLLIDSQSLTGLLPMLDQYLLAATQSIHELVSSNMREIRESNYDFNNITNGIRDKMKASVKSRIKAIQSRNIPNKDVMITSLQYLLSNLENKTVSDIENIALFVSDVYTTMSDSLLFINNAALKLQKGEDSGISNEALIQFVQDYFGMYNNIIKEVKAKMFNDDSFRVALGNDMYSEYLEKILEIDSAFNTALNSINVLIADMAGLTLMEHGIKAGSETIRNYVREQLASTDNDINMLTRLFLSMDRRSDEALRIIFSMTQAAENKTVQKTDVVGQHLVSLLNKVGRKALSKLYEVDIDGRRTGYLVRDKLYGKFKLDYETKLKELRAFYGVPEGRKTPEDITIRRLFNKDKNAWLDKHCHRKYTAEYYEAFDNLSDEATDALDAIQYKIYNLVARVKDTKTSSTKLEALTTDEYEQLLGLYIQKKQLSSLYQVDGSMKTGISLDIAEELSKLHEVLDGNLLYQVDQKRFELDAADKKANYTLELYDTWLERNVKVQFTDEFKELLASIEKRDYGTEYADLQEAKRLLLSPYRSEKDFSVLTQHVPASVLKAVRNLDRDIRRARKSSRGKKSTGVLFKDIAKVITTPQYAKDRKAALSKGLNAFESWERTHHILMLDDSFQPNSYYTMVVPLDKKYLQIVPGRAYSELSDTSKFRNELFDASSTEFYQPKSFDDNGNKLYDNSEAYASVEADLSLFELYEAIRLTMEHANDKITHMTHNDPYKLPLKSGSMFLYVKGSNFKSWLKDQFLVKGDDIGYLVEAPTRRPDGTPLKGIPTYYIEPLDNPANISSDLVGITIDYFRMATNFEEKSAIMADIEVIKELLRAREFTGAPKNVKGLVKKAKALATGSKEPKTGAETNIYAYAKKFVDMNIYGDTTLKLSIPIKGRQINIAKGLLKLTGFGTLVNLGLNIVAGTVGLTTSLHKSLMFAISGRYYNVKNLALAWADTILSVGSYIASIGTTNSNNLRIRLMESFEIGKELSRFYSDTHMNKALRSLKLNWAFGIYTASDFIIKGTILHSIMLNYRYSNGEYVSQESFMKDYQFDKSLGKARWRLLESSYDLFKVENGKLIAKDPKKEEAFNKVKDTVRNTVALVSSVSDGILTGLLKTQISANIFGAMTMMHRQYLPQTVDEMYTMQKLFDYNTLTTREAVMKTPIRFAQLIYKDLRNKVTLKELYRKYKKNADESDKANIKWLMAEVPLILIVYPWLATVSKNAADADKKNWIKLFIALLLLRHKLETQTPYNAYDTYNTVKLMTPLFSVVDNAMQLSPILAYDDMSTNKKIKYGVYDDWYRWLRGIMKLTPIKNLWELQDPAVKRKYIESQIDK